MLRFLFPRLTADESAGEALFAWATKRARERHWYAEGQVPDTLDGRFRMLATVTALLLVRLERAGEPGNIASAALTERFIHVMESEHRELGLGDPTLGKTVRKLVGSLSRKVDVWRLAGAEGAEWRQATAQSIYRGQPSAGLEHVSEQLAALQAELASAGDSDLVEGRIG